MKRTTCDLGTDSLLGYVAGDLPSERAGEVAQHLGECRSCREEATDLVNLNRTLDACCSGDAVRWHRFSTPFGAMHVASSAEGLVRLSWEQPGDDAFVAHLEDRFGDRPVVRDGSTLGDAERQLREYFAGQRSSFELPVDLSSLSDFDRRVLREARRIGFGDVLSYGEVARRIGRPRAARAVGGALGRNPVGIVVPCHRVVRSDGSLGGYTGGVEWKRRLLTLEGSGNLFGGAG